MNILSITRKSIAVAVLGTFLTVGTSAFIIPATTEAAPKHSPIRHEQRVHKPGKIKRHKLQVRRLPVRHEVRRMPVHPHRLPPRYVHKRHKHHHGDKAVIAGLILGAIIAGATNN